MTIKDSRRYLLEDLHRLVEELPETELHTARRFLEYLCSATVDPVLRAVMEAPEDDEPLTPEDLEALRVAHEELARGEGIRDEDLVV